MLMSEAYSDLVLAVRRGLAASERLLGAQVQCQAIADALRDQAGAHLLAEHNYTRAKILTDAGAAIRRVLIGEIVR